MIYLSIPRVLCSNCKTDISAKILEGNFFCPKCGSFQYDGLDSAEEKPREIDVIAELKEAPAIPKKIEESLPPEIPEIPTPGDVEGDGNKSLPNFIQHLSQLIQSEEYASNSDSENQFQSGKDYLQKVLVEESLITEQQFEQFIRYSYQAWDSNALYLPGYELHKVNIVNGSNQKYSLTFVAREPNLGIHPIRFFSETDSSKPSQWVVLITPDTGDRLICVQGFDQLQKLSEGERMGWHKINDAIFSCFTCETTYHAHDSLLKETHIPMKGFCAKCDSAKFIFQMKGYDGEVSLVPVIYNVNKKQFCASIVEQEESLDIEELWKEYQMTDAIEPITGNLLSDGGLPGALEDIIRLELKLHESSAELYSKLRGIPISYPNNLRNGVEVLLELVWLNDQVLRLTKRIG